MMRRGELEREKNIRYELITMQMIDSLLEERYKIMVNMALFQEKEMYSLCDMKKKEIIGVSMRAVYTFYGMLMQGRFEHKFTTEDYNGWLEKTLGKLEIMGIQFGVFDY